MNVKQLIDELNAARNKRIEIFTPNPTMNWELTDEHWIEKVEVGDNCIIHAEYWEPEEGQEVIDVERLLGIVSQINQEVEIIILIPDGEELYIKAIENDYALIIYADYPYSYKGQLTS